MTMLMYCAAFGWTDVIKDLGERTTLDFGAQASNGKTALDFARMSPLVPKFTL